MKNKLPVVRNVVINKVEKAIAYMEVKSAELEAYRANLRRGKAEVSSQLREEEKSNNQLVHNQSTQLEIVSKIEQITEYKSKN